MKIKSITCQHTRQVKQFEPAVFSMTADITEDEDPMIAAKQVQDIVIRVLYKDDITQRDKLLHQLVGELSTNTINTKTVKEPVLTNNIPQF